MEHQTESRRRSMETHIENGFVGALLPPRPWPILSFTFLGPLAIGLVLHALVQLDRWLMVWGLIIGALALPIGALPNRRFAGSEEGNDITASGGGDRRLFVGFLAFALLAAFVWPAQPLRIGAGAAGLLAGAVYLVTLGRSSTPKDGGVTRLSAHLIPWCYMLGPAGAVGLARLAMRPTHLGEWRDLVYLGLGRVAAVAAILFWIMVERELRRRAREARTPTPDIFLPYRLLLFLLALTGLLVPGGGTPFALSWAVAWFIAAWFERRLRIV